MKPVSSPKAEGSLTLTYPSGGVGTLVNVHLCPTIH